ncbi:hypothetical protein E2C01_078449 [Portunus trituberculatus]|uniref:Uncharacterized protein n=1 Tax=Portunus trituberculatus TaxID=210409 RepID=A0A5B7IML8_PORTR|nr:hypothetical protein [Portunus trituberculatus]
MRLIFLYSQSGHTAGGSGEWGVLREAQVGSRAWRGVNRALRITSLALRMITPEHSKKFSL